VELKAAAAKAGVAVPTIGLTERAQLNLLADYEGDAFDQSFLAEQYASHETTVALFSAYLTDARHGSLREFAAKTLPALQQGLEEVQWLATRSF
jgi:putative membrane protein